MQMGYDPATGDSMCQTDFRARYASIGERHSDRWNYATLDGGVKSRKSYPLRGSGSDYGDWLYAPTDWKKK